ncbi:hypothetical protein [Candidatus Chrysopegis kryptomonas]|jgi:hypothetical protein|uniref:Uncharacterized protein n=1 Tax=Candidatus Chryseopegocella kryptomonas TaxID=1633643 RepID=A0A0P1MX42_9BACT|nr:hypothetical protein [Candidatus Chrysopegis kryptomonas]CUT00453.1 hypothetical protein JGI23_00865 [Candidatus Chrysopegis kryptomonas]
MVFVAETEDNRLVIFGNKEEGYFYIEFTGNVETPRIEKYKLTREVLLGLLERKLDRYSKKGLNVVFERMAESD